MRKSTDVAIADEGRDKGKVYRITEMPARKAEKWAMRALLALAKSGADIPDHTDGMAGLAQVGFRSLLTASFDEIEPLLDEMLTCIVIAPNLGQPHYTRALIEDDIEEISTLLRLRMEVFDLHTGFSTAGALSKLTAPASRNQASPTA